MEDDTLIASGLVYALSQEEFQVTHCVDICSGQAAIGQGQFDLALLDLSLPDGSGYSLLGILKEKGVPVIFLTAIDDEGNVVQGLEMGADDYVTKPFRLRELIARIKGVLRRQLPHDHEAAPVIAIGSQIKIHTLQAKVFWGAEPVELTPLEYRLLLVFAGHKGQVLTRAVLLENIWDMGGSFVNDNTLSVYVRRLREKLGDDAAKPHMIQTVRGMGYQLND